MKITIEVPDEIAQRLDQTQENLSRRLLEIIVADAYNSGKLNTAEVGQILKFPSRLQTHAFLRHMGVYLNYDEAELETDLQTLQEIRAK